VKHKHNKGLRIQTPAYAGTGGALIVGDEKTLRQPLVN
jgi:hypothetical protein